MTRIGQHFLKNRSITEKIVRAIDPHAQETVIEIGPGHGELTRELVRQKKGATKIIAIEKDHGLLARLVAQKELADVEFVYGDALEIIPQLAKRYKLKAISYKLIGNIPYYISGRLFRTLGALKEKPSRCLVMLQKEVAERLVAQPPRMNRLAASVQIWADAKILCSVPRKEFAPIPKVDSAVVVLETRERGRKIQKKNHEETIRALFEQPRKTVLNNIASAMIKKGLKNTTKSEIAAILTKMGIRTNARPQDLSIEDIKKIANELKRE